MVLAEDPDLSTMHMPICLERGINVPDNVAGNREPDSFAPARLRKNKRVDSNETSIRVHQGAAAVSGIDRSIRLHEDSRIVFSQLARDRAHDAHTDGIVHSQWAAERQYEFTLFEAQGVAEGQGRESIGGRFSVARDRAVGPCR